MGEATVRNDERMRMSLNSSWKMHHELHEVFWLVLENELYDWIILERSQGTTLNFLSFIARKASCIREQHS